MFFYLGGIVEGHIAIPEKKKSLFQIWVCFLCFCVLFYFGVLLRIELRMSGVLGKFSATWAIPKTLLQFFKIILL
jgi:hypothetical protein